MSLQKRNRPVTVSIDTNGNLTEIKTVLFNLALALTAQPLTGRISFTISQDGGGGVYHRPPRQTKQKGKLS